MHLLVLLRHGESVWNRDNLFTGWTDVDLSDRGVEVAVRVALGAGRMKKTSPAEGRNFESGFSHLPRHRNFGVDDRFRKIRVAARTFARRWARQVQQSLR